MKKILFLITCLLIISYLSVAQNVGIGTATPEGVLHLKGTNWIKTVLENNTNEPRGYIGADNNGTITLASNAYWNGSAWVYPNTGSSMYLLLHRGTNQFEFRVRPDGGAQSTPMVIEVGGNIGIGTTAPQQNLGVGGGVVIDQNNNNTGTSANILSFGGASGEGIGSKRNAGTGQWGLDFYTNNTQKMTIANNGNVGIGGIQPNNSSILDVSSSNKGITIPRLTKVQREAISNPQTGLMVYDLFYKTIFMYDGFTWVPLMAGTKKELSGGPQSPADNTANSQFGASTSIDSLWAIAGAPYHNSSIGAAYIYQKQNEDWVEVIKLIPDDAIQQLFGSSVAIDYPYAVVGAPGHNGYAGCVYVFFHNGSSWAQVNKFFKPINNGPFNYFGYSVDVSGNNFVVGSPGADDAVFNGGAIYAYTKTGAWNYLSSPTTVPVFTLDSNANMGSAVAIAHEKLIAGAPGQKEYTISNGPGGISFFGKGSVAVFNLSAGYWLATQQIAPSKTNLNRISSEGFGTALDIHFQPTGISPYSLVVGAPLSYHRFISAPGIPNVGFISVWHNSVTNGDFKNYKSVAMPENYLNSLTYQGYKYGSAVSAYHTSSADSTYPGVVIQVYVGMPGLNNNNGGIEKLTFSSEIDEETGKIIPQSNHMNMLRNGIVKMGSDNSKCGFSLGRFGNTNSIAGLPGTAGIKGSIVFDY
jgi:hypothetical protein